MSVEVDAELVAAEAGHGVALAKRLRKAPADLVEELIAEVMAEGVVDLLEAIEVHHDHPHRVAAAARGGDGVLQAIEKQGAIGQAGQTVMSGLVDDLLFALRDSGAHAVERRGQL